MNRLDIIQTLIDKINATKYLEIGVQDGLVFNNVKCEYKVGVDPSQNSAATLYTTSDDFFATNSEKFDVIFVDGLHHNDQVYRDINNALRCLNDNGYIVCHDMNPDKEIIQLVPPQTMGAWTGDCWKAWVRLRSELLDFDMFVIDTDYGCGIIHKGKQNPITIDCELSWNNLVINRNEWLNLISTEKFTKLMQTVIE